MAFDTVSNCEESKDSWLLESAAMGNTAGALQAPGARSRAWVELDRAALEHNTAFLRSRLPEGCRLMPAVKADAYGHGAVPISRELNRLGVDAFCVACAAEGISLRQAGITGEILVLGYTSPEDFPLLRSFRLSQTVTDHPYALTLNRFGKAIHVHIGIDTGMHRVGIRCENLEEIAQVCGMENLIIDGLFTHLPASDSPLPQDRAYTRRQITAFYQVVTALRQKGFPCPGLHILASYGIMNLLRGRADTLAGQENSSEKSGENFSDEMLAADYVRPGIILHGLLSTETDSRKWAGTLRPVLSLKTRVASVRLLHAGEPAGYGLAFTARRDTPIATISIGYADGLPRALSHGNGSVLIHGCRAPIIGRICMDQTLVDISAVPHVQTGDEVVVMGTSGSLEITAGQIAAQCDTITNEILSRLGTRLGRVLV